MPKFRAVVRIEQRDLREAVGPTLARGLLIAGSRVGAALKAQTQARFANGGDEEVRWPKLWVDNDAAVQKLTAQGGAKAKEHRSKTVARIKRDALQKAAKIRNQRATGEISTTKAREKLRHQAQRRRYARELARIGANPYRRGGKPLRDTGALEASITYAVRPTDEGGVAVVVGTPLAYGRYQQDGFTTKGPNFIPLTRKALKKPRGAAPKGLIRGVDYVMAGKVTVPPRPFVRLTAANREEVMAEAAAALNAAGG